MTALTRGMRNEEGSVKTLKRFHDRQNTLKTKTAQAN